jgi:Putative zinc-finger
MMKCDKARLMISLYVGDDLPEKEIPELLDHLQYCGACNAEFEELKKSQALIKDIAGIDIPEPLPDDFAGIVHKSIAAQRSTDVDSKFKFQWRWKPTLATVGTALILVFLVMLIGDNLRMPPYLKPGQIALEWEKIEADFSESIQAPVKLADWQPSADAGVYVVMHRADPDNDPDLFVIDYLGESSRISSYRSYPWLEHRKKKLLKVTGFEDNIYIVVYPMPGSSKKDRIQLEKSLIKEYNPYFNKKTGV